MKNNKTISKHEKGPDLKKQRRKLKLNFKSLFNKRKGKRLKDVVQSKTKGDISKPKKKLTFKQKVRKLPKWIKLIILVVVIPIVVIIETLVNLLIKILKPIVKYIMNNFISFITLVILIFTVYTGYILLKETNNKIEHVEDQITLDKEIQSQELEEYNKNIEEKLNGLQQKQEEQDKQTTELREKMNKISVTSRGSTTPRTSANVQTQPVQVATTGSKAEYQAYAKDLCLNSYGWSENDFNCLVKLWERESNWNPNAHNKSSGAHGICQSLPASKMASEGADYYTNGKTQIRWGLKYIKSRYGSPSNAWAHSQQKGWY